MTTWLGFEAFESDVHGRVADADSAAVVLEVPSQGDTRGLLVIRVPADASFGAATMLFGTASLTAADFLTGGALP